MRTRPSSSVVRNATHGPPHGARVQPDDVAVCDRHRCLRVLLIVALVGACGENTLPPPDISTGFEPVETVDVRRRLFELNRAVPHVVEGLVADEEGSELIVLLPDRGLGAIDFLTFMPRLVAVGYRPVALNPRGIEGSDGPLGNLTLHDLAADVAGVIETLDAGPVHVLGHGFGNRVAHCVAADRPDLVRSVILLAADGQAPGDAEAHSVHERLFLQGQPEHARLADLQAALFGPASDPPCGWTARCGRTCGASRMKRTGRRPGKSGAPVESHRCS